MALEFKMPKLGESVTEGTVGRWLKQVGDQVEQYEPLLEVTTDKVDTEVPSPVTGTLLQIMVAEGDTVPVGTIIAVLGTQSAAPDAGSPITSARQSVRAEHGPPPAQSASQPTATASVGFISPVVARLVAEHSLDLSQLTGSGREGRITKQDVQRFVAERDQAPRQVSQPAQPAAAGPKPAPMPMPRPSGQPAPMPIIGPTGPKPAPMPIPRPSSQPMPVAYPEQHDDQSTPALGPGDELVPLSAMRRSIAAHMVLSKKTAPHVTTVMEADLSAVAGYRERNRAEFERQGVKLTLTPFFVRAVVVALREVPVVNASYSDEGMLMHSAINIGVAVALADGLIVPVIRDADDKSLLGLARAVNDLADRARTRRLNADEVAGGTFSITNHGVSGSLFAMPIINQPQAAILGVGAVQKRAVVLTQHGVDAIAIRPMCYLSLTFDHRLVDGATADQFLSVIKRELEQFA